MNPSDSPVSRCKMEPLERGDVKQKNPYMDHLFRIRFFLEAFSIIYILITECYATLPITSIPQADSHSPVHEPELLSGLPRAWSEAAQRPYPALVTYRWVRR